MSKLKRKVKKLFKSKVFTTLFSLSLFLLAGGTALLLTTIPVQAASNYGLEVSFWFDQPADTSYSDLDKSFVVGGINNESESLYTGGLVNLADINKYLRDPTSGGFLNDNTDWVDVLITQPAADKAKQGYSFAGYYGGLGTAENGELFYDAEGSYKGPGYLSGDISYDNWYEYYGGGGSHDLYLVAKWTPHITFNNGFTDDVMSGKVDFLSGTEVVQTREGYIFGGYYTGEDGSGTQVYNSDGAITDDGQTIDFSSPITLYAYWIDTWASSEYISQPSGAGTEASPYLISSAEELAWIANQVNFQGQTFEGFVFKQTEDDIDLFDNIWLPIGTESTPFKGTFYGSYNSDPDTSYWIEGITISNEVDYSSSGEQYIMDYAGLFGVVENATIKEVWLSSGEVYANTCAGGIVGNGKGNVNVSNCDVAEFSITCDSLKSEGMIYAGGIIAYIGGGAADSVTVFIDSCTIETSVISAGLQTNTEGTTLCTAKAGGVICSIGFANVQNSDITIKNCFVDSGCKIYAATSGSGAYVAGIISTINCSNNFCKIAVSDCEVSASMLRVNNASTNTCLAGGIIGQIFWACNSYEITISGCKTNVSTLQVISTSTGSAAVGGIIAQALLTATTTASLKMTDNYVSTSISGGASDTNNSVSAVYVGGIGGFIQINAPTIADIDFNNCVVENSKISGYATNGCVAGLIGVLNAKSQTSLNIKNCDVLASDIWLTTNNMAFVGGLVGWANRSSGVESNISIEKCDVLDGSITSSALATYTGGLIGADYSTSTVIDLCRISASIYASSSTNVAFIGGILGDSSAALTITRSEITSDEITGKATKKCYTGGIAGYASDITAKTCFVKCRTISATSSADNSTAGGLVGQSNTTNISACSVEAEVQASTVSEKTSYAGGLIGYGKLNIKGCLFEGTVAGSVAGLIAGQATEITKASNILCRTSSELTTLVGSSSDGLSPINVIVETDSGNYYIDGGDGFAKWGIVEGKPLPAELFWIASGASVCTIDWLTENGYNGL